MKNRKKVSLNRSIKRSSRNVNTTPSRQSTSNKSRVTPKKKRHSSKYMLIGSKQFKVSVATLRDIQRLQKSTKLLISKAGFSRLVHELILEVNSGTRIQSLALEALQEALESYAVQFFQDSYACALHARRSTLIPRDLGLIQFLRTSTY